MFAEHTKTCISKRELYISARHAEEKMLRISNSISDKFADGIRKSSTRKLSKLNRKTNFLPTIELKTLK